MYAIKDNTKSKFFVGITDKQRKFIIQFEFMVVNEKHTNQFIQNLKSNPNKVHDMTREIKRSLKKHIQEKSIKPQIHKIKRITDNNGKTEYNGRTYANNIVALEPGWIRRNFELSESEFYKLVTTVTFDETQHKTYTVTVGRCDLHTPVYKPKFVDMHHNALKKMSRRF